MEDRKGDVRIYIISIFFFACTIGGGIFLCMYMFLPDSESISWYLFVGMTLVTIPWLSWFLIFIYRCFSPIHVKFDDHHNGNNNNGAIWTPKSPQKDVTSPCGAKSPVSGGGGERSVQFGPVVEMGSGYEEQNHNEEHHGSKEEQEIPTLVLVEH